MMPRLTALAATLMVCACSSSPPRDAPPVGSIDIQGIVIWNQLAYVVRDVMVEVPATGRFAGCGNILPRTRCQTSFPSQRYAGNEILLTWAERGEPRSTEPFTVEPPPGAPVGAAFWLVVEVFAPGQAGARLVQP